MLGISPAFAATTISIAPQGELPWSEYTDITVVYSFDGPAKDAWARVDSIVYKLDKRNITTQFGKRAVTSSPTAKQVKVCASLALEPGEHTFTVALSTAQGELVEAASTFFLTGNNAASSGTDFFGAAPFMLWPEQAQVQVRCGKVALEGSFKFNIPGGCVTQAGFMVNDVQYFAAGTGRDYYTVTVELPEGTAKVRAFIIDSAGHTFMSDPAELLLSKSGSGHPQPTHAGTSKQNLFSGSTGPGLMTGGLPSHSLAGRFQLQLEVDGPQADLQAPGAVLSTSDEYSFCWMTSADAVNSFDTCPPIVWRGDSCSWEYKFTEGDWKYHHLKLTGEISSDGRKLKKLAFVDRFEGPRGGTEYSEMTFTVVDVPLPRQAKSQGVPFSYAFEGKRWMEYLTSFSYNYYDTANASSEIHYSLETISRARLFVCFW